MSNKVKDIDIKSRTYYFFDGISIKIFYLNTMKEGEKSHKNILNYYIRYVIIIKLNYDKNKIKQIKRSLVLIIKMESKDELKEIAIKNCDGLE